jgi:RNA polymerase sigma-70 factor (ECF subfamily)
MTTTDAVWTEFGGRLRGFIAKRVRHPADVDDVIQDVFTRIHAGLGGLKESEKLEAWLFQVARRAVVDSLRRRPVGELPEDLAEKEGDATLSTEVAGWLAPLMTLLPEEDQEALRLTDLGEGSQKDLASRLGLSATGARSRVQRARKRLKAALLDCCHIDMDRRGNAIGYRRKGGPCGCSCS